MFRTHQQIADYINEINDEARRDGDPTCEPVAIDSVGVHFGPFSWVHGTIYGPDDFEPRRAWYPTSDDICECFHFLAHRVGA